MRVLLASSSPRRRTLLEQLHIPCHIEAPAVDEEAILAQTLPSNAPPSLEMSGVAACRLAEAKAENVLANVRRSLEPCLVVAADTVVVCNGRLLNKPADADDARAMLKTLSNQTHHVVTGLCAVCFDPRTPAHETRTEAAVTEVTFRALSDDLVDAYIRSGEPMDKAGAYGIQGLGAGLVERIDGCYFNVVGLPIALLCRMLDDLGHPLQSFWRPE